MKDEKNHTPPKRIDQMSRADIVTATKRVIATKFNHGELLDIKSYVTGLITVSNRENKDGT